MNRRKEETLVYWTSCWGGTYRVLYRRQSSAPVLLRYVDGRWIDAFDRFIQVTQGCEYDQVDETLAFQIQEYLSLGDYLPCGHEHCEVEIDEDSVANSIDDESNPTPSSFPPADLSTFDNPLSALNATAIALHELFLTLTAGGFTEDHALTLISKIVLGAEKPIVE